MSEKLPQFLCIGAQKAGTTWLDKQLRDHKDIWLPPMKEVHFFDYVDRPEFRKWITWHLRITLRRELLKEVSTVDKLQKAIDWQKLEYFSSVMTHPKRFEDEWYKYIFSGAPLGSVTGEITPEYSTISDKGIDHILKLCPDIKVIYIIRDPVKRAASQLKMNMVRNGDFKKVVKTSDNTKKYDESCQNRLVCYAWYLRDFFCCSNLCERDKTNTAKNLELFYKNLKHYSIKDRGDYETYIPRWDSKLKDNIIYIPFKEISSNPTKVLQKVFQHIGVDMQGYDGQPLSIVHKGGSFKTPKEVVSSLEEELQPQYDFLRQRFSSDFFDNI